MRGARQTSNDQIVEALRGATSISGAAKAAGCSRRLIHVRAAEDPRIRDLMAVVKQRRDGRSRRKPNVQPPEPAERPAVRADEDFEAKLRKLGLGVLAQVARDQRATNKDRVAAARYLVQLTEPVPLTPPPPAEPEPERVPVKPLSAAQVAAALRFKA